MNRTFFLLATIVCSTQSSMADLAPDRPHSRSVFSKHLIKLDTEIPGYEFFLFHGKQDEKVTIDRELELSTEKALAIPDNDTPPLVRGILAVPEKVMQEYQTHERLAELCKRENRGKLPPGVVVGRYRGFYREPRQGDPRTTIVWLITLSPDEAKGVKFGYREITEPIPTIELTESMTPKPANKNDAYDSSSQPRSATVIAGIALAVAMVTGGLWLYRRNQNSR